MVKNARTVSKPFIIDLFMFCIPSTRVFLCSMAFFAPVRTNLFVAQRSPARAAISPLRMADADLEAKVSPRLGGLRDVATGGDSNASMLVTRSRKILDMM